MRRLALCLALALPAVVIACGSDNSSTGPTVASLAGTWNLQTVNGAALPFTLSNSGGVKTELLSEVATVSSNGNFTETEVLRVTTVVGVAVDTLPSTGTFTLSGNLVSINLNGSGTVTGTLNNNTTFTINDSVTGDTFVFVKQP